MLHDYAHLLENDRNLLLTEETQELQFEYEGQLFAASPLALRTLDTLASFHGGKFQTIYDFSGKNICYIEIN